jgi:putative transposase
MTQPRPVFADRTLMLTRRCAGRKFFLSPDKETTEAFLYCFAVAVARFQLDVYWLSIMSNHHHDGLHDNRGNIPEFMAYFHSLVARCLNVHLGRWENFWASEQASLVHLGDADAIFDKMIYSLTNPVKDHLVDTVLNWPGFTSLPYQLADKPLVIKRPKRFFDKDGSLPEQVELRFTRPPEFAHLSQDEWATKIRTAIEAFERAKAEERRATGKRLVGRKAIRRQSPFSCPKSSSERRGLRPRVASRNTWRRIELLQANKVFLARYRAAYVRRCAGELDVLFPYGSYKLRKLGLARCESPPTTLE